MNEYYIEKIYRQKKVRRLISLGVVLGIVAILLIFGGAEWYNNANYPTNVSTVIDFDNAKAGRKYIKISADKMYNLGLVKSETTTWVGIKTGKSTTAKYVAINLDGKLLAVELPVSKYDELKSQLVGKYVLVGKLCNFDSNDAELYRQTLIKGGISEDKVDEYTYTGYLQYQSPAESASVFFVFAFVVALIGSVIIIPSFRKNRAAFKSLIKYSNGDLGSFYRNIDEEIKMPDVYKKGRVTITQNYIIGDAGQFVFSLPLSELMWTYKKVIQRKTYGIPTGKTYGMCFVFSDKKEYYIEYGKNEQDINEVLGYICEHVKSCVCGYTEERKRLFKSNPNEFVNQWSQNKNASV